MPQMARPAKPMAQTAPAIMAMTAAVGLLLPDKLESDDFIPHPPSSMRRPSGETATAQLSFRHRGS